MSCQSTRELRTHRILGHQNTNNGDIRRGCPLTPTRVTSAVVEMGEDELCRLVSRCFAQHGEHESNCSQSVPEYTEVVHNTEGAHA